MLPKLTVYENIAFAIEMFGLKKHEVRAKVLRALDLVGLKNMAKQYPHQLSGGEKQRVSIARAIVNEPKLLICDEPTGNLDPETSFEVIKVIENINKLGTTVIMATHDIQIVNSMNKRVITLKNGEIIRDQVGGYNENN